MLFSLLLQIKCIFFTYSSKVNIRSRLFDGVWDGCGFPQRCRDVVIHRLTGGMGRQFSIGHRRSVISRSCLTSGQGTGHGSGVPRPPVSRSLHLFDGHGACTSGFASRLGRGTWRGLGNTFSRLQFQLLREEKRITIMNKIQKKYTNIV